LDWPVGLAGWIGRLDWPIGLADWIGRLDWNERRQLRTSGRPSERGDVIYEKVDRNYSRLNNRWVIIVDYCEMVIAGHGIGRSRR